MKCCFWWVCWVFLPPLGIQVYGVVYNKRPVFCVNCKHFYLPPNQSQTKYGKCKKFVVANARPTEEHDDVRHEPSPSYYVNGIYIKSPPPRSLHVQNATNSISTIQHQEALLCRALPYLCGKEGLHYESNLISE